MGQDAREIHQQGLAVIHVKRGKKTQNGAVEGQAHHRQEHKGDKAVAGRHYKGPDVVAEDAQGAERAFVVHQPGVLDHVGKILYGTGRDGGPHHAQDKGQHNHDAKGHRGDEQMIAQLAPVKLPQLGKMLFHHASSLESPSRSRRSVSSLPRIWQISTAPPGVTSLPAAAMRTGHISVAFFTPRDSARLTSVS